jgi:hypothetical protein
VFRKGVGETEVEGIRSFRYSMGGRLPEEYLMNLVLGWAVEGIVKIWLINSLKQFGGFSDIQAREVAHDASRVIRFHGKEIMGEADLMLKIRLREIERETVSYVEVQRADRSRIRRSRKKKALFISKKSRFRAIE